MLSPLRYPGSKRRLANYIQIALSENDQKPQLFVETFAGGASVALHLLDCEAVERIGLIEKDPIIAAFWKVVFSNDVDWLIKQIETIDVTLENWAFFKNNHFTNIRQQALSCLFLNRTSFSGIIAPSGGPIGGYKQESDYKIDCRFPRQKIIDRIVAANKLKDRVAFVLNMSYESGVRFTYQFKNAGTMLKDVFFYFDPPFFRKADRLYRYFFEYEDHKNLRDLVTGLPSFWLMSYDFAPELEMFYGSVESTRTHVELLYSAAANGGNRPVKEAIITNLPTLPSDLRLYTSALEHNKNGDSSSS
jgi:DNA adenine methylase